MKTFIGTNKQRLYMKDRRSAVGWICYGMEKVVVYNHIHVKAYGFESIDEFTKWLIMSNYETRKPSTRRAKRDYERS